MSKDISKASFGTTIAYGLPGIGAGYMYLLMSLYVMKFSTDVLLIAPAVMGVIFSISRIWDAISDPIAGYLSDRTTFGTTVAYGLPGIGAGYMYLLSLIHI